MFMPLLLLYALSILIQVGFQRESFDITSLFLSLINGNLSPQSFQRLLPLLRIVLCQPFLHHLRCAFHKLLAVDQAQTQQVLHFLDDLRFSSGVEGFELDVEESLFFDFGGGFLLGWWGSSSGTSSCRTRSGEDDIGDI